MDKKNIISLVLGLIIGALAIWLIMAFTGAGSTLLLTANKLVNSTTPVNSTTLTTTETITVENLAEAISATKDMLSLPENDASRQKFESALNEYLQGPSESKAKKAVATLGKCKPTGYDPQGKITGCERGLFCRLGGGSCGPVVNNQCSDCIPPK